MRCNVGPFGVTLEATLHHTLHVRIACRPSTSAARCNVCNVYAILTREKPLLTISYIKYGTNVTQVTPRPVTLTPAIESVGVTFGRRLHQRYTTLHMVDGRSRRVGPR